MAIPLLEDFERFPKDSWSLQEGRVPRHPPKDANLGVDLEFESQ
jgi:hypothetical protein